MALTPSEEYVDTNADAKIYREIVTGVTNTSTNKYLTIPDTLLGKHNQYFVIVNASGYISVYNIINTTANHLVRSTVYEDPNYRAPRLHGETGDAHISVTLNTSTTATDVYVTYIATSWWA